LINSFNRRETEVTAERAHLRLKRVEETKGDEVFKVGDNVEVYGLPNHPSLKGTDIQGWRRAKVANVKGKNTLCHASNR
jgi:hypothetical protein